MYTHETILPLIGKDETVTRAVAYAHNYADRSGRVLGKIALIGKDRVQVPEELAEMAKSELSKMIDSVLSFRGNTLLFTAMGMDYEKTSPDDVGNYRIRTHITNPNGRKFFIEVSGGPNRKMHVDHVVDVDQQNEFNAKSTDLYEKIQQSGGFYKHAKGTNLRDQYERYQQQPYNWYRREMWDGINREYSQTNVLNLVNQVFDCNFKEMAISDIVSPEQYTSVSPK